MAEVRKIDADTLEAVKAGEGYKAGYWLDNSYTNGVDIASLVAVKGDGASLADSGIMTTLQLSDASDKKKASGIIVTSTPKDQYGRRDDITSTEKFFPFGDRENRKQPLVKKCVVIYNDTAISDYRKFRTVTEIPSGVVETAGTTALVGTGTTFTDLKVGDFITVNTDGEEKQIASITDDLNLVVTVAFTGSTAGQKFSVLTQIDRPTWVAEDGKTTIVQPVTSSAWKQQAGYVVASNMEQIDLLIDPNGTVIA